MAALARQLAPGCCNRFRYCAREWLLKPDERERRGQRERERCRSRTSPRAAGLARRGRGSGCARSHVLRSQCQASGAGWEGNTQSWGWWCYKKEWRGNTHTHRVNHCLPWGCDTQGRLARAAGYFNCTHRAKPAPIPCVSSSWEAETVPTLRERIVSPLSSHLRHG